MWHWKQNVLDVTVTSSSSSSSKGSSASKLAAGICSRRGRLLLLLPLLEESKNIIRLFIHIFIKCVHGVKCASQRGINLMSTLQGGEHSVKKISENSIKRLKNLWKHKHLEGIPAYFFPEVERKISEIREFSESSPAWLY
jgi:hypothetical protein